MTTIIEVSKDKSPSYMGHLMNKFVSSRCSVGLLRFFAAHPNGRFSKLAIVHAIDEAGGRWEIEQSLEQMIEESLLKTSIDNGICFYSLTKEEALRRLVLNMSLFELRDWQLALERM
jgi:hypothetical protein